MDWTPPDTWGVGEVRCRAGPGSSSREEDPGLREAGQPTWTVGLPGLMCHVKGGGCLLELGAHGRVRPGDLGESFNHLHPRVTCLSKVVMTPVHPTSP